MTLHRNVHHLNIKAFSCVFPSVSIRSIDGISYVDIDFKAIKKIEKLKHIVYEKFFYCSLTPDFHIEVCRPKTDGAMKLSVSRLDLSLTNLSFFLTLRSFIERGSPVESNFEICGMADGCVDVRGKYNGAMGSLRITRWKSISQHGDKKFGRLWFDYGNLSRYHQLPRLQISWKLSHSLSGMDKIVGLHTGWYLIDDFIWSHNFAVSVYVHRKISINFRSIWSSSPEHEERDYESLRHLAHRRLNCNLSRYPFPLVDKVLWDLQRGHMLSFVYSGEVSARMGIFSICFPRHQPHAAAADCNSLHSFVVFDLANSTAMCNNFGFLRLRIRH